MLTTPPPDVGTVGSDSGRPAGESAQAVRLRDDARPRSGVRPPPAAASVHPLLGRRRGVCARVLVGGDRLDETGRHRWSIRPDVPEDFVRVRAEAVAAARAGADVHLLLAELHAHNEPRSAVELVTKAVKQACRVRAGERVRWGWHAGSGDGRVGGVIGRTDDGGVVVETTGARGAATVEEWDRFSFVDERG